jgi:hypothetical protein
VVLRGCCWELKDWYWVWNMRSWAWVHCSAGNTVPDSCFGFGDLDLATHCVLGIPLSSGDRQSSVLCKATNTFLLQSFL